MPNPYFQFKKFTVFHDLCAMKVGIDGVLLGVWANAGSATRILDIGTGSGLIALMLAQRNNIARIDAIDIEASAVQQAEINIKNSPWAERVNIRQVSLQHFAANTTSTYDLIVSNPPFFVDSLKTPDSERTNARHTDTLTHDELISFSKSLLAPNGKICIILPVKEGNLCKIFAEKSGLYCSQLISVLPKPNSEEKRLLLEFSPEKTETNIGKITIETDTRHQYSKEFSDLAKDFYLKL